MTGSNNLLSPGMATSVPTQGMLPGQAPIVDNSGISNSAILLLIQQWGQNTSSLTQLLNLLAGSVNGDVTGPLPGPLKVVATHLASALPVDQGGTGNTTLQQYGVLIGAGQSPIAATTVMTDGQLLVGQLANAPIPTTVSGDATLSGTGALTVTGSHFIVGLPSSQGGTGRQTLTTHGVLIGEGTAAVNVTAAMTDGQLLVGQTANDPLPLTISGDGTFTNSGVLTVTKSNGTALGPYATAAQGQMPGTGTNDNAAAGDIGEEIEGVVASGSSVSLTTTVAKTITHVTLTPGDWDVWGYIGFTGTSITTVTYLIGSISATNNTLDQTRSRWASQTYPATPTLFNTLSLAQFACGQDRFSLGSTTTIYLVADASFAADVCSAFGTIIARRRR